MRKLGIFLALMGVIGITSCTPKDANLETIKIIAPNGAPALSQVKIYSDSQADDYTIGGYKVSFDIVSGPDGLKSAITSKTHEVVVAPVNLGASLYKSNQTYQYAANISDGNLYLASTTEINEFTDLAGKKLVFFGENTINQVVVEEILSAYAIDTANITYLAATSDTQAQLLADKSPNTVYLVAEPALSAAKSKMGDKEVYVLDIQEAFSTLNDNLTFLQAGVFVNKDIDEGFVSEYLAKLQESIEYVNDNPTAAAEAAKGMGISIPAAGISGSNLVFRLSQTVKDSLNQLVELGPTYFGGSQPSEDFYY